jgi:hypothetical protein
MRCKNIILMAFYYGDNDQEITDTLNALEIKHSSTVVGDEAVKIITVSVPPGGEKEILTWLAKESGDECKSLLNTNDNGLYLIVHAGPTRSKPDAEILGKIAASLLNAKIKLRKINLVGCHTAGDKLSKASLDKSVLSQFCKTLSAECTGKPGTLGTEKQELKPGKEEVNAEMLKGLSVCAYQPEITVFDESSLHYNNLIKNHSYKDAAHSESRPNHSPFLDAVGAELD